MPTNFKSTPFHIPIVRSQMTRAFPSRFGDLCDEIRASTSDWIDVGSGECTCHLSFADADYSHSQSGKPSHSTKH